MFDQDGAEAIVNGVRKHIESKLESLREPNNIEPRNALLFVLACMGILCMHASNSKSRASRW